MRRCERHDADLDEKGECTLCVAEVLSDLLPHYYDRLDRSALLHPAMSITFPRGGKTEQVWANAAAWCQHNPRKTVAVITAAGTFSLVFTPKPTTK